MTEQSTGDLIINAAVELVTEKGYKGATTKAIAERAGVNEVTLFRQFGSKKGIIEAAIEKYSFIELISETLEKEIVWDINKDLIMIARLYQEELEKKRAIILISYREAGAFPELDKLISRVPLEYKKILTAYFTEMIAQKKMRNFNPDVIATNFMLINFGYFLMKSRLETEAADLSIEFFLANNMAFFIESLFIS